MRVLGLTRRVELTTRRLCRLSIVCLCVGTAAAGDGRAQQVAEPDLPAGIAGVSAIQQVVRTYRLVEPAAYAVAEGTSPAGAGWVSHVRAMGSAMILQNGLAVFGNLDQIVVLDSTGRTVAVAGRTGAGPGEFRTIRSLFPVDDRIGAYDGALRRISVYTHDGRYVRDVTPSGTISAVVGWLPGTGPISFVRGLPGEPRRYVMHDSSGAVLRTIEGPLEPANPRFEWTSATGATMFGGMPCRPLIHEVVVDTSLVVVDAASNRVLRLRHDGDWETIFQATDRPGITAEAREWAREVLSRRGMSPGDLARALGAFGNVGEQLPSTWDRVIADPLGRLWLQHGSCGTGGAAKWEVIDLDGRRVGLLDTSLALRAVRGDGVLALLTDAFDQIFAARYSLRWSPGRL